VDALVAALTIGLRAEAPQVAVQPIPAAPGTPVREAA
jgi:hypothetical protein